MVAFTVMMVAFTAEGDASSIRWRAITSQRPLRESGSELMCWSRSCSAYPLCRRDSLGRLRTIPSMMQLRSEDVPVLVTSCILGPLIKLYARNK